MATYQIKASIEEFETKDPKNVKLLLKGCGKYLFEFGDEPERYNILEPINKGKGKKVQPKFLLMEKSFSFNIVKDKDIAIDLFSHAVIENKKLKFEIEEDNGTYKITSIAKAE